MGANTKDLKIIDVKELKPIREELGRLSASVEYKIKNPNSNREMITEEETFNNLRKIIDLVNKL